MFWFEKNEHELYILLDLCMEYKQESRIIFLGIGFYSLQKKNCFIHKNVLNVFLKKMSCVLFLSFHV